MKLVTIATHSDSYFPYLKKACERYDADLIVLGWEQKWTGYSFKSQLLQKYLKGVPDDEIVCVIDSFDVILLRPLAELEKTFRDFSNDTGARLVVGFDRPASKTIEVVSHINFGTSHGYALNAGTYIGYSKEIRQMIDETYINPQEDDQKTMTAYSHKYPHRIYIDTSSIFFLTINYPMGNFYDPTLMKVDEKNMLWYRSVKPFFAHGNGNTDLNDLITLLGYPMSEKDKNTISKANKRAIVKKARWYVRESAHVTLPLLLLFILIIIIFVKARNTDLRD